MVCEESNYMFPQLSKLVASPEKKQLSKGIQSQNSPNKIEEDTCYTSSIFQDSQNYEDFYDS